jgi:hypothetical protein
MIVFTTLFNLRESPQAGRQGSDIDSWREDTRVQGSGVFTAEVPLVHDVQE